MVESTERVLEFASIVVAFPEDTDHLCGGLQKCDVLIVPLSLALVVGESDGADPGSSRPDRDIQLGQNTVCFVDLTFPTG